ncbi:MAG: hypothetical protein EXS08_10865 [Planctomycetes bacterium]|nr:hypothetical protein [Planctomycetota bacterium]
MSLRSLASVVLLALLSACAGAGHQNIPRPDENSPVSSDRCRVYIARQDVAAGSVRQVRVLDGEAEIGAIAEDEYLCWERRPERGMGTLVYEGPGQNIHSRDVENVFDLPRQAGTTTWFAIEIPHSGRQPQIRQLSPLEGRALIAQRRPAKR